jgi:hypothetical protein
VPEIASIFDRQLDFDPAGNFEEFVRQAPARWVVYLLSDADDRPVQLLCVKNLRNSLKRRLGEGEPDAGLSKRVNYRELVRRVRWRRVDSAFEADWIYYEAARVVFPQSYRGMVGFRPAWFIHINPQTQFPRYTKTIDLSVSTGELLGPLEDKHAAARLFHLIEDAFDLCRYHHILVQAPGASACAYKEMGKCPAPCDGTISLDEYRRLVELSMRAIIDPAEIIREQTNRMQQAAAELRFELAAKIKAYVDQLSQLGKGPFRHVGRLRDFCYLSLQHGPRPGENARVFLITPGRIEEILGEISEPLRPSEILRAALTLAEQHADDRVDQIGAERIGIVAHHLFSPKQTQGVFLRMERIDEKSIAKAWRDLRKQLAPEEETEGEGVMKELQSL